MGRIDPLQPFACVAGDGGLCPKPAVAGNERQVARPSVNGSIRWEPNNNYAYSRKLIICNLGER
jgi:hypothetical protein